MDLKIAWSHFNRPRNTFETAHRVFQYHSISLSQTFTMTIFMTDQDRFAWSPIQGVHLTVDQGVELFSSTRANPVGPGFPSDFR